MKPLPQLSRLGREPFGEGPLEGTPTTRFRYLVIRPAAYLPCAEPAPPPPGFRATGPTPREAQASYRAYCRDRTTSGGRIWRRCADSAPLSQRDSGAVPQRCTGTSRGVMKLVRAAVDSMFAEVALTEQSLAGMHWDAALLDVAGRMFDGLRGGTARPPPCCWKSSSRSSRMTSRSAACCSRPTRSSR